MSKKKVAKKRAANISGKILKQTRAARIGRNSIRNMGEVLKEKWRLHRWLSEAFTFKMYLFIGALIISGVAYHGESSLDAVKEAQGYGLGEALLCGVAAWLSIAFMLHVYRALGLARELNSNPLEWTPGATAGTAVFVLISLFLGFPLTRYRDPLTLFNVAIVELIAITSGIAVYFWIYWSARQKEKDRSIESLRAEHKVWSNIFTCSIVWVGVFVGGYLLSVGIGATLTTSRDRFPDVSEKVVDRVIVYHGLAAFYGVVGIILWMLRPLHRRLEQISRAMDLLGKDKVVK